MQSLLSMSLDRLQISFIIVEGKEFSHLFHGVKGGKKFINIFYLIFLNNKIDCVLGGMD